MAQAMDPATLAAMPAGKSPPGVLPNLQNPYSLGPVVISVGAVLLAIMVVFVLVRIYTKVKIVGKFSPDDCGYTAMNTCSEGSERLIGYCSHMFPRCGELQRKCRIRAVADSLLSSALSSTTSPTYSVGAGVSI